MKSTAPYKKTFIFSILLMLSLVMFPIHMAKAGYGLRLQDAYLKFYMEIDDKRIVKLIGLPLEGEYWFDLNKAILIFTPEGSKASYKLSVVPLERGMPKALFSRDVSRDGKMLIGYDTKHWRLSTKEKDCKEVFASEKLGQKMNFTMTDIARINIALAYLTGQPLNKGCYSHVVSKAVGSLIGMPLHSYDIDSRSDFEVKTVKEDETLKAHKLPEKILPLSDDIYAKYLETLLSEEAQASYLQTKELLRNSGITKVKALKQLLLNPVNRRKIAPNPTVGSGAKPEPQQY